MECRKFPPLRVSFRRARRKCKQNKSHLCSPFRLAKASVEVKQPPFCARLGAACGYTPLFFTLMQPTAEQIRAARENLQNPAFWERVKETERGIQVVF